MWSQPDKDGIETDYASDITLFTVKKGLLTNTKKALASFPLNVNYSTSIYGMNGTGTKLYTVSYCQVCAEETDETVLGYNFSMVNAKTGALGPPTQFWYDELSEGGDMGYSAFSNPVIAQPNASNGFIGFYTNTANPAPLFTCTSTMALPCGDFVFQVAFDPSGKYLFVSDGATNTTPILEINTTKKTAKELNDYLPGYVTPTFSHDGKIVYAQYPDNTVLINTFNPATGELGDNYTLSVSNGATITAW